MVTISISFEQFLGIAGTPKNHDYSAAVKQQPCNRLAIPSKFGKGHIFTTPMVGGAGLVIMQCRFHQNTEIYADQVIQDNLSFTICLEGSLENRSPGRARILILPHEVLFARYNQTQRISSYFAGQQDCTFITIQLSPDWLSSEGQESESDILADPFWQGIYNSGQASELMLTAAHEVVTAAKKASNPHHFLCAKAMELWSHQVTLLRRLSSQTSRIDPRLKAQDIAPIHLAADILQKEMVNPPSLIQLSRRIGINDNKLKQGFKQVYGTTAYSFLQQRRLQKAKRLISEQNYNVLQASTAVGYRSASHFSRLFKQTFGISPKQLL